MEYSLFPINVGWSNEPLTLAEARRTLEQLRTIADERIAHLVSIAGVYDGLLEIYEGELPLGSETIKLLDMWLASRICSVTGGVLDMDL